MLSTANYIMFLILQLLKIGDMSYTGLNYSFTNEKLEVSQELQAIASITTLVDQMRTNVQLQVLTFIYITHE